jgi:hypothetical protein
MSNPVTGAGSPAPSGAFRRAVKWVWGTCLVGGTISVGAWVITGSWLPSVTGFQHAGILRLRYEVTAPKTLRLNETGTVSVTGYYWDGNAEPKDSIECTAEPSPPVDGLSISEDCDRLISIVNDESNFAKGNDAISLILTIHVRRSYDLLSPVDATARISLLDEAHPVIVATDAPQDENDISVLIGSTVHFRADFKVGKALSNIRCQWYLDGASASNPFSPNIGCDGVAFAARRTAIQVQSNSAKVGLTVTDMSDHAIGKASATIHFHLPLANFSALVVDTSARMRGPEFEAAMRRINSQIDTLTFNGGWLSLTGFGGEPQMNVACSKLGVHQLYRLAPFNQADAQAAAKHVAVGPGNWAPLGLAIETAASQFAQQPVLQDRVKYPDNLFYFIILTGGGDTCSSTPLAQIFQTIRGAMTKDEFRNIYVDLGLLTAVIAASLPPGQAAAVMQSRAYKEDNRAVLFAPRTTEELIQILEDLGTLANPGRPRPARASACNDLLRHISDEDEPGKRNLRSHCTVVAQR